MVGILGLGSRPSPTPESRHPFHSNGNTRTSSGESAAMKVQDNSSPAFGSGSGIQHFFSLPHWTRRVLPYTSSSARKSVADAVPDELGMIKETTPKKSLMLDKELPPTPSKDVPVIANANLIDDGVTKETRQDQPKVVLPRSSVASLQSHAESSQFTTQPSTAALAQAALHLGIPHTMPRASMSTEVNTIDFISSSSPSAPELRHKKSTQSIKGEYPSLNVPHGAEPLRTRGISLGPGVTSAKGKEKERPVLVSDRTTPSPSRILSRRPSFWSRKQADSSASSHQHLSVPSASPRLPAVQPTSPFQVDFDMDSESQQHRSRRNAPQLVRRHSERAPRHPLPDEDIPVVPQNSPIPTRLRSNNRPATADPSSRSSPRSPRGRPATADSSSRLRSRSYFTAPTQISSPPLEPTTPTRAVGLRNGTSISHEQSHVRPRSSTNPPLLHRLSVNIFASSPPSATKTNSFFGNTISSSPSSSSPRPSLNKAPLEIPKPQTNESPDAYVHRLGLVVGKADVAGVLASSGDSFYVNALKCYIDRFNFVGDPLDVALRRLLMDIGLPRETQQIDRVMEAFAARYLYCNPNLFISEDHPYILAFSLIMLHTDAFNKSNRRKMTKADYLKNTSLPGVIPEVLDCFYDNIVFAPFIFIEDPLDVSGHPPTERISTSGSLVSPMTTSGSTLLGRPSKIDPYYLITHNHLDSLRVDVESLVPAENPYDYEGTGGPWDHEALLHAFAKATVIHISSGDNTRLPSAFFGLSVGGLPSPSLAGVSTFPDLPPVRELWTIKVTMVALLNRKDDTLGSKRPTTRKWKPYSVVLTGSQLLLFRDPSWASTLLPKSDTRRRSPIPASLFKPDEVLSIKDALAVFDRSYTKDINTFRLVLADGRHILFQSSDEAELNAWVSRVNYASVFKSAGIRMRPLAMSGKDVELTGVAAATSHLHDLQVMMQQASPKVRSWNLREAHDMPTESEQTEHPARVYKTTPLNGQHHIDMEAAVAPEVEGASQFKATFDQVKAELAAAQQNLHDPLFSHDELSSTTPNNLDPSYRAPLLKNDSTSPLPRTFAIKSRVENLDARISAAHSRLDADMRFVRNVAKLTPFQKATRDRLQDAIQSISKQIALVRLDVARLTCHRNVLLNDLVAEEKGFRTATMLALQAATETLQSRRGKNLPRMTLSFHDTPSDHSGQHPSLRPHSSPLESSTNDSFSSALDFGCDRPSSSSSTSGGQVSNFLGASFVAESPVTEGDDSSTGCYPFTEADASPSRMGRSKQNSLDMSSNVGHNGGPSHEKFYTAQESLEEQAEEWDKTRAAKRVSLIKLPPDLRLSTVLGKPLRYAPVHDDSSMNGINPCSPDSFQNSTDFRTI